MTGAGPAWATGAAPALVIAHRGDWLEGYRREGDWREGDRPGPQNSITAVLAAVAAGADGAEVDARLSADGTVVLHHDAGTGPADTAAGGTAPEGTPICALADAALGHLSTLAGLLDALDSSAGARRGPVVLDIEKRDLPGEPGWDARHGLARREAELLEARHVESWAPDRRPASGPSAGPGGLQTSAGAGGLQVVVSSFDPDGLGHFRRYAPGTATALLLDEGEDWRHHLAQADNLSAINPAETMAIPELFSEAASRGLAVVPWTVDSPARAVQLAALGAAGLITNRPRAVLRALGRDRRPAASKDEARQKGR